MATVKTVPFEVAGQDGGPLRGEVRTVGTGSGRPAVILCHGFKGFKDWGFFPILAQRVANAGITTVAFNFSGSGVGPDGETFSEPERFGHATHSGDLKDVEIVIRALRNGGLAGVAPPRRLGLFGHSRGGGTAILAAAADEEITTLVTWSAIATVHRWPQERIDEWETDGRIDIVNARTGDVLPLYRDLLDDIRAHGSDRLDILAAAGRIERPWLIVHGEQDESVPALDAMKLSEAAGSQTQLQIVEGGSHTFGARHPWAGGTPELDHAMDLTAGWFSRHLS